MYDSNLKSRWDYENSIAFVREEAEEKGFKLGIEIGRQKARIEIATRAKEAGMAIPTIAKATRLSIEEIERL